MPCCKLAPLVPLALVITCLNDPTLVDPPGWGQGQFRATFANWPQWPKGGPKWDWECGDTHWGQFFHYGLPTGATLGWIGATGWGQPTRATFGKLALVPMGESTHRGHFRGSTEGCPHLGIDS